MFLSTNRLGCHNDKSYINTNQNAVIIIKNKENFLPPDFLGYASQLAKKKNGKRHEHSKFSFFYSTFNRFLPHWYDNVQL